MTRLEKGLVIALVATILAMCFMLLIFQHVEKMAMIQEGTMHFVCPNCDASFDVDFYYRTIGGANAGKVLLQ